MKFFKSTKNNTDIEMNTSTINNQDSVQQHSHYDFKQIGIKVAVAAWCLLTIPSMAILIDDIRRKVDGEQLTEAETLLGAAALTDILFSLCKIPIGCSTFCKQTNKAETEPLLSDKNEAVKQEASFRSTVS